MNDAAPSPKFETGFEPAYGIAQTVAPDVRRVVCENPTPFTFKGTGTFIVSGGDGSNEAAVIDPGPENDDHLYALLQALDGLTLTHIVVTHTHRDHSPLARALKSQTGAQIVGCAPYAAQTGGDGEKVGLDASNDTAHAPDAVMAEGDTITIGQHVLTAIETPGHTATHLSYSLDGTILFPGDHVMGWSTTVIAPPDGHMRSYMHSLDKLTHRDEALYLPAHGGVIRNAERFVRGLMTHRRQRENQIVKQLEAGPSSIAGMVPKLYPDLDKRLRGAAALSVRAHIDDLIERERVTTADAEDVYRLI